MRVAVGCARHEDERGATPALSSLFLRERGAAAPPCRFATFFALVRALLHRVIHDLDLGRQPLGLLKLRRRTRLRLRLLLQLLLQLLRHASAAEHGVLHRRTAEHGVLHAGAAAARLVLPLLGESCVQQPQQLQVRERRERELIELLLGQLCVRGYVHASERRSLNDGGFAMASIVDAAGAVAPRRGLGVVG